MTDRLGNEVRSIPRVTSGSTRLPRIATCVWLAGAVSVLALACVLRVGEGRQVLLPWLGRLPETCTLYARFGIDCPGCGLTRSFISLARGDLRTAWELSPVSLLMFAYTAVQIPLALAHLSRASRSLLGVLTQWNQVAFVALLLALLLQWVIRIVFDFV